MAKIKFGMMMTDARGKLGGQVFSKNRSGAYVRTKVTPVNPRTESQQANRSLLGSLSSGWSSLNELQRNAWNSAVANWQKTNVFGDIQNPTGKNLFTGLNKNRLAHYPSLAIMEIPPTKSEFASFSIRSGSISASTGVASVTLSAGVSTSADFRVRATPSLSPGTSYVTNQLRSIGLVFNVNETGLLFISADYNAKFGNGVVGSTIGVEVTPITEYGQLGVPALILLTVTA